MAKTSLVTVKIDTSLKQAAESVFNDLGITVSQAVSMFYKQVQLQHAIPFAPEIPERVPNQRTSSALKEAKHPETLKSYKTAEALFEAKGL